jgi:hypothetical protein
MSHVVCSINQDGASEIRRRLRTARLAKGYLVETPVHNELAELDSRIIFEFLQEEFELYVGELFLLRLESTQLIELHSWDYPGGWLLPVTPEITGVLKEGSSAFIFSKSGSYTLSIKVQS